MDTQPEILIQSLLDPTIYPHPCERVELVETHISWVLLTGFRAYKIKKPVNLGFVDFTSLERRRFYCEEELRLNRRLAPDLYLKVVPITGSMEHPQLEGEGPAIEYAVCMAQFEQTKLLSKVPVDQIQVTHIDHLADLCAEFHKQADVAEPETRFGTPEQVLQPVAGNFSVLQNADAVFQKSVQQLQTKVDLQSDQLLSFFAQRKQNGMIRECHGDLHLGNMFLKGEQVTVFDGIEFNDDFRWIDIISDIAFTMMDLEDRHHHGFANRLLNRWLEQTGDYDGLRLLPFYCAYRAAVRAKVDAIRLQQHQLSLKDQQHLKKQCLGYLELALRYMEPSRPALMITMGPSGSGKTTITQRLIEATNTIRVRSDVERKRLFGLKPTEHSDDALKGSLYSAQATLKTYDRLEQLATTVMEAGYPVVVDATFLKQTERLRFIQLAKRLNVPFLILKCEADEKTMKERIRYRNMHSQDASEADEEILESQLLSAEWLITSEIPYMIDAGNSDLLQVIQSRLD